MRQATVEGISQDDLENADRAEECGTNRGVPTIEIDRAL
jgi:hypothetical protein